MSNLGHNFAHGQLRSFVQRIERLDEELAALNADKKEVYAEARATGFDVKIIKKVIAIRRKEPADVQEEQALVDLYMGALDGGVDDDAASRARAGARAPAPAREESDAVGVAVPAYAPASDDGEGAASIEAANAAPEPDLDIPASLDRRQRP